MKARFALVLLVPLAAQASLGPRYGGELRVAVLNLPATLEPRPGSEGGEKLALGMIHETLVRIAADGSIGPSLAGSWERKDRVLTLALVPGLTFHDGKSLTASDVVRSLKRFVRGPTVAGLTLAAALEGGSAFRAASTEDLPGLEAPDPLHASLKIESGATLPLASLASLAAAITSESGAGAGAFMPTVSIPGRSLAVTAFLGHCRGRPFLDRVVLTRSERAPKAELHLRAVDLAEGEEGLATRATLLLLLDPEHPPFETVGARSRVRRAIEGSDMARLVPGSAPSLALLSPDLLPPLPDGLFPEPSGTGGSVTLSVGRDVPPLASQRTMALLESLGLHPHVADLSPDLVREKRAGARLLLFSPEVPDPTLALLEVAALVPGSHLSLEAAFAEENPDRRLSRVEAAETALRQELVAIPILAAPLSFGGTASLHGARIDASGRLLLEDAWLEP